MMAVHVGFHIVLLLFLLPGPAFSLVWKRGGFLVWYTDYEYALVDKTTAGQKGYTWYDGRDFCAAEGGDLWSTSGKNKPSFFSELSIDSYVWTGVNRIEKVSEWKPPSGNGSPDTKVFLSKLGLYDQNKKCGALLPERSPNNASIVLLKSIKAWKRMNCGNELFGFVCERRYGQTRPTTTPYPVLANATSTGRSCPSGWRNAGTKRCYKEFEGPSSGLGWKSAEQTCLSLPNYKPNLACANSQGEIDALTRLATVPNPARFWFGLFKESADGPWMWADNTRFTNVTNFHRYIDPKLDYGGGVIDNRAIPRGSWDVSSDRDGLRSVVTRYICQVEKDPNYK